PLGLRQHRVEVLLGELLAAAGAQLLPRTGGDEHSDAAALLQHRLVHQQVDPLRRGGRVHVVEGRQLVGRRHPPPPPPYPTTRAPLASPQSTMSSASCSAICTNSGVPSSSGGTRTPPG